MRFPEEIVVERVVPTFRGLVVRDLSARGLTQSQIADLLGLSQSAVSKHLAGRFEGDAEVAADPRVGAAAARVASGLASGALSRVAALAEFVALVRALESRGVVCAIHEREMPDLAGLGCDLCVRAGASVLLAEQDVLADVRAAVRVVEASPHLAALIPKVGSNVACALPGARDPSGVAAVPGSLFVMKGRVAAAAPPEFGVSRHVAEVALAAARADPSRRACMNLATDARVLAAARAAGLVVREVPAAVERDPARLDAATARGADVLHHSGDFGVEPQTYLLGSTAREVADRAASLAAAAAAAVARG